MKKNIPSILAICLLFCAYPSFPQKGYSPGYVVELAGDTTHGLIQYRRWDKNPKTIYFIVRQGAAEHVYGPTDVSAFFVAGEHYESAIVDVDVSPTKIHLLDENPEPRLVTDTVFLQSLFRGEKVLLYLKDRFAKEHFFIDDNGYKLLVYKKFKRMAESLGRVTEVVDENEEYKRQLFLYFNNCPQLQQKIERSDYAAGALTNLFSSYHECINKSVEYSNERRSLEVEKGLTVGATGTRIQFEGEGNSFFYILRSKYNQSLTPSVGLFLNAKFIRSRGLMISNDLFYTFFNINGKGTSLLGSDIESSFSYHFLKMHNLLSLDVSGNGLFHIAVGPSSALVIKKEDHIVVTDQQGGKEERKFESRAYELGLAAGLGIKLGKITADLRYERSTGISKYRHLDARTRRLYFLIKYTFKSQNKDAILVWGQPDSSVCSD